MTDPPYPTEGIYCGRKSLVLLFLALISPLISANAQTQRTSRTAYITVQGGLSSYLGDNNTTPFNRAAFGVADKLPLSAGFGIGYQFNSRWSAGLAAQYADYPIIPRFDTQRDFSQDPTVRRTYEISFRYMPGTGRLTPYVNVGFHMSFGDVTIYEAKKIRTGTPLNQQSHYVYGPVIGVGLDYSVTPSLSVIADVTSHVTLMDDSVDGRLPLGPPQPANLKESNRFGTFDLLSAVQIGVVLRPFCGQTCSHSAVTRRIHRAGEKKRSSIRVSSLSDNGTANIGYYYAVRPSGRFLIGVETGLIPRSVYVRFTYPDGSQESDLTRFTGAYLGLSAIYYPIALFRGRIRPHVGTTIGVPVQSQFIGGVDFVVSPTISVGLEGRYMLCARRKSRFTPDDHIIKAMERQCEYTSDFGVSMSLGL